MSISKPHIQNGPSRSHHRKISLVVLDSVGIGAAPDAADFGDAGSATLPHIAQAVHGLNLPTFQTLGLGNIPALLPDGIAIEGCPPASAPRASFGAMRERSQGKDTVTGHWEMAGLEINPGFHLFPKTEPTFPAEMIRELEARTGRKTIGNTHASGVPIINALGAEHAETGAWIVYTSADSVFQIAANIDLIPLEELYAACEIARELCNPLKVGRVIARPFRGTPGNFERTQDRIDYAYAPEEPLLTEQLVQHGVPVYAVGKIEDILAHRGITKTNHTPNTRNSEAALEQFMSEPGSGFIWANFIDFDMLYGHRRDPVGYGKALEQTDQWLAQFLPQMGDDDLLIITADHGNDPTFTGNDHTREYVPLLVYGPNHSARSLGIRDGFYDISQSVAHAFKLPALTRGISFL